MRRNIALKCCYGRLDRLYPAESIEPVDKAIQFDWLSTMPDKKNSLHKAAKLQSTASAAAAAVKCKCKSKCDERCACVKKNVKCTVHCHNSEFECTNLSALTIRTDLP